MAKRDGGGMSERESWLHCARVYLAEAKRRRTDGDFHATLLRWAANARREGATPKQRELFGRNR